MPHITENEMTTKHSPGPWTFQEHGCLILDARTGSSQCAVAHVPLNTYNDEGLHNARLIDDSTDRLPALADAHAPLEALTTMHVDTLHLSIHAHDNEEGQCWEGEGTT